MYLLDLGWTLLILTCVDLGIGLQTAGAFAPVGSSLRNHGVGKAFMAAEGTNIPGPPYSGPAVKPILDSVNSPADMKRLDMRQLKQVSEVYLFRLGLN
jgi:hypothetical protein